MKSLSRTTTVEAGAASGRVDRKSKEITSRLSGTLAWFCVCFAIFLVSAFAQDQASQGDEGVPESALVTKSVTGSWLSGRRWWNEG